MDSIRAGCLSDNQVDHFVSHGLDGEALARLEAHRHGARTQGDVRARVEAPEPRARKRSKWGEA
jgi:hypothetical protein